MKYKLTDLLIADNEKEYEYKDEALASSLYYNSLSTSLREMDSIKKYLEYPGRCESDRELLKKQNDYNEKVKNNEWLNSICEEIKMIRSVNFDKIPGLICMNSHSVDSLVLDYSETFRAFLIEFKNCSKKALLKFINDSGKDGIIVKLRNTKTIINSYIDILNEVTVNDFEVFIVYNKNDVVSENNIYTPKKRITEKDDSGKQSKATRRGKNKSGNACRYKFPIPGNSKKNDQYISLFEKRIMAMKFKKCTVMAALDFCDHIRKNNFTDNKWGGYEKFLKL